MSIVTTVSKSYLAFASVLMDSVAVHHPDARRVVLVLDDDAAEVAGAEVMTPATLIPDARELKVQEYIYGPIEYATALKPKLLMHELAISDQVIFLDPDMRLFAPMSSALTALQGGATTLLTPHRLTPPSFEDRTFYEWTFKAYGVYNTAFVAVTQGSLPFLEWWDSRLRRDCLADLEGFEWVDQRIIDLAPSYFDIELLKDHGYNVCWWNLEERPLSRREGTWFVGPDPLVLMHYSGVRPVQQERGKLPFLVHSPTNSIAADPEHVAAIQEIEDEYVADLMKAGYAEYARAGYGFTTTPGGQPVSQADRRGYRRRVLAAESAGRQVPLPDDLPWGAAGRFVRVAQSLRSPGVLLADARSVAKLVRSGR